MSLDTETKQIMTDAEHVINMTQSQGWQIIYPKLTQLILDLQNINNINDSSAESALADMRARKMAADLIFTWLKRDVYGAAEQAAMQKAPTDEVGSFISRE